MAAPEFHLFLPQMRMSLDAMVERAREAESAGFTGVALMDHLAPPQALGQPMYEAMTTAMWLAAHTSSLTIGHLVLCDAFRHPAVLAKEAVTVDHASGGRFELGIGWGSVPDELDTYGVFDTTPRMRVDRLAETLEVLGALWSGEVVNYEGNHHRIVDGQQLPTPVRGTIPLVIGGAGARTLDLVARHATWWNLPLHRLDRLEEMMPRRGDARASIQEMVAFVPDEAARAEVAQAATRRFGPMGVRIGNAAELRDHYLGLAARGMERFYVWFADFAPPATLAAFGDQVIAPLRARSGQAQPPA